MATSLRELATPDSRTELLGNFFQRSEAGNPFFNLLFWHLIEHHASLLHDGVTQLVGEHMLRSNRPLGFFVFRRDVNKTLWTGKRSISRLKDLHTQVVSDTHKLVANLLVLDGRSLFGWCVDQVFFSFCTSAFFKCFKRSFGGKLRSLLIKSSLLVNGVLDFSVDVFKGKLLFNFFLNFPDTALDFVDLIADIVGVELSVA